MILDPSSPAFDNANHAMSESIVNPETLEPFNEPILELPVVNATPEHVFKPVEDPVDPPTPTAPDVVTASSTVVKIVHS